MGPGRALSPPASGEGDRGRALYSHATLGLTQAHSASFGFRGGRQSVWGAPSPWGAGVSAVDAASMGAGFCKLISS